MPSNNNSSKDQSERVNELQNQLKKNRLARRESFFKKLRAIFDQNDELENEFSQIVLGLGKDQPQSDENNSKPKPLPKPLTSKEYMGELHKTLASKTGLKEIVGYRHNPEIVEMFAACGHDWVKDDETPWCAAFIGWGITATSKRLGVNIESTRKLTARSYLNWGRAVDLHEITKGDIVVIPRGNSNWQGHVFVFDHWDEGNSSLVGLGGNQRNAVNLRTYNKDRTRILGIRRAVLG